MFKKALQHINKFYDWDFKTPEQTTKIFELINEIISFDSCAIFYLVPNQLRLELQTGGTYHKKYDLGDDLTRSLYNVENKNLSVDIKHLFKTENNIIASRLVINGVVLGIICAERKSSEYNEEEELVFNTYAKVISNIIKDIELSKILTQHAKTLEKSLEETRNAYETIKNQNKKIKENEKLQNQFLANISHDLRTPLNSIICLSEILSNKIFGNLNTKQQEYVEDIRISGIRLLGMINEVLDITKLESHTIKLNITQVEIPVLIKEVCNILKPIYTKKNIKIKTNIPEPLTIAGDYIKLQQVLFNILGNAIKFSPENSAINIVAEKSRKTVKISVQDFGIGISKQNQKRIFKKFYQVENTLSKTEISTGLGLTIAKEFVKLHNGEITVQSELQKGTTFTIELPL